MKTYLANLRRHLTSLHRFSGRETVDQFWAWAGTVLAALFVGFSVAGPYVMGDWLAKVDQFARENPQLATRSVGPGHYSVQIKGYHPELMPDLEAFLILTTILSAIVILLLAAALTRRLHDSGRSGLWGLLPLPFLLGGFWLMPQMFGSRGAAPDMQLFFLLFVNNVVYLAAIALLVFFTTKSGTPGPNRYGPPPA